MASATPADVPRGVEPLKRMIPVLPRNRVAAADGIPALVASSVPLTDSIASILISRLAISISLESDGVQGRGDFCLERVVGRLGAVRNDKFRSIGQRRQHGQHRLSESPDLVEIGRASWRERV